MDIPSIQLSDGNNMPMIGFGTHNLHGSILKECIKTAYQSGIRMIDTAWLYKNEQEIGRIIRSLGIRREEIFLISKCTSAQLWGRKRYLYLFKKSVKQCYEESCKKLGTDYIDLFLLHSWQFKDNDYRQIVELKKNGCIRSFGITQATSERLQEIYNMTGFLPQVQQMHMHPLLIKEATLNYMKEHNVAAMAIRVFKGNNPKLLKNPVVLYIAEKYNVTARQVVLRWLYQKNVAYLFSTSNIEHVLQNISIFDFYLTDEEMISLDGLNENLSFVPYEHEGVYKNNVL